MDHDHDSPTSPQRSTRARVLRQASTDAERALWRRLRDRRLAGLKFRRQHPIGPHYADFACMEAQLVIELDGGHQLDPANVAADARRTAAMTASGFHVMRFTDREALLQLDAVAACILEWLTARRVRP